MRLVDLLPPLLTRSLLVAFRRTHLRGDFSTWAAAAAASGQYRTDITVYAKFADEVRRGLRTSSRILSPLLSAILLADAPARVVDFGGNLGYLYFDVERLASHHIDWWHVVELPEIVAYGKEHFAQGKLQFFPSIAEAARTAPNVVLCFHVLQYLEFPFRNLATLLSLNPRVLVLHEFPVARRERFLVQHLLPELGGGSRPVRIFSRDQVATALNSYDLLEEIDLPPWDRTLVDVAHVARIYRQRAQQLPIHQP